MYPEEQIAPSAPMSPDAPVVYAAVTDQATDAYATAGKPVAPVMLEPEEFKNRLLGVGGEFQASGMSKALWKIKEDQDLMHTILKSPEIVKSIAGNQNPKNDTPAGIGVNAVTKAVTLSERVTDMAEQLGINLTNGGKIPSQLQGSFMDGIKKVFADSQIQPGSMEAVAQRDYFTALLTGKGVGGAMEAYGARYNQLADETRKMKNDLFTETVKKDLEFQVKNANQLSLNRTSTQTIASILTTPGANVSSTNLMPIAQEASAILSSAKENPTVASGSARALLQKLSSMGVGEEQLTSVARVFGEVIKTDDKKTEMYNNLSTIRGADSDGALTRWKFDIATPEDNEKILKLMDKFDLRKSTQEALAAAAKQTAESQAKAKAAITPVTEGGMTPQQIEAQGKVVEQKALIPGKVQEQKALIPGKVAEQKALMPGKVDEAKQIAVNKSAIEMKEYKEKMDVDIQKELKMAPIKIQQAGLTEAAKKAGEVLGNLPDLESQQKELKNAIDLLNKGTHNLGPQANILSGGPRLPLERQIGNLTGTTEAANTRFIMDSVNKLAADGLKTLGSNPSTVDLEFWTKDKPNESWEGEAVKKWLENGQLKIANRVGWAESSLAKSGGENSLNKPGAPRPVGGAVESSAAPKVKKYNPQTGKVE